MSPRVRRLLIALAGSGLAVWALWAGVAHRSPSDPLPSAIADKAVPATVDLPVLLPATAEVGPPAPFLAPLGENGEWPPVTVVNFWGSWCATCDEEMPDLTLVADEWLACAAKEGQADCPALVGVAFYDPPENALDALRRHQTPYLNFLDNDGNGVIGWGVYGAPETFFVDARGIVRHRHVGRISLEQLRHWTAAVAGSL